MSASLVGSFFQAEDGIRDRSVSRGLGDVYKRQPPNPCVYNKFSMKKIFEKAFSSKTIKNNYV
ncbi:hypothetical protein [Staphylococcus aureus]